MSNRVATMYCTGAPKAIGAQAGSRERGLLRSKFQVKAKTAHQHRSPVAVIGWIVNVLQVGAYEKSVPDMRIVVALKDVLPAIVQPTVAEDKPHSPQLQVTLVV